MRSSRTGYVWGILVLLAVWQLAAWWAGETVLAGPVTVLTKLVSEARTERFWHHVGSSSLRVFAALVVSFVSAVPLGLFLGSNAKADRLAGR